MVFLLGKMVVNTKEIFLITIVTELVFTNGLTEDNI